MLSGTVAVIGGRNISPSAAKQTQTVAAHLVGQGCQLVTGCATGADAAFVSAALAGQIPLSCIHVFAAFGSGAAGACGVSNVQGVQSFADLGGGVTWWAGGGSGVPLAARLARRAARVVNAAPGGVVAVEPGRGSLQACQLAAENGAAVVVVGSAQVANLGAGSWQPLGYFPAISSRLWVPAQHSLL